MLLALFSWAALALAPDPLAAYSRPARLITLADGRELNLVCMGTGAPTVLLEAGWSSWSLDWASVQARLAAGTRVCAYDRAGLGFSSPDSRPKTLKTVVDDEAAMLERAGIDGPLILVGHSKGANFVRAFAASHPERVAGMVLVDPGGPERDEAFAALDAEGEAKAVAEIDQALKRCLVRAKTGQFTIEGPQDALCFDEGEAGWSVELKAAYVALQRRPSFSETRLAEFRIRNDLPAAARGVAALGELPLIVLKADDSLNKAIPEPRRSELDRASKAVAADLAKLSQRGELRSVSGTGHMIAQDRPDAVVSAIEAVIAAAR